MPCGNQMYMRVLYRYVQHARTHTHMRLALMIVISAHYRRRLSRRVPVAQKTMLYNTTKPQRHAARRHGERVRNSCRCNRPHVFALAHVFVQTPTERQEAHRPPPPVRPVLYIPDKKANSPPRSNRYICHATLIASRKKEHNLLMSN